MGDRETRLGTVGVGLGAEGLDATGRLEQVGCHTWRTRNDLAGPTSRNRSRVASVQTHSPAGQPKSTISCFKMSNNDSAEKPRPEIPSRLLKKSHFV